MSQKPKSPLIPLWARIILVIFAFIFVGGAFQLIGHLFAGIPLAEFGVDVEKTLLQTVTLQFWSFLGILLTIYVFRVFLDRKAFASIGISIKNRFSDIIAGFIVALAILGIGFIILYFQKQLEISQLNFDLEALSLSFILYFLVSLFEEFLLRGYILNNMLDSMNKYLALFLSSAIFAIFHGLNPNLSWISMFNLLIAGLTLGAAYIYTRNLWFPISLHLFWNFIQGSILGFNVSGLNLDSLLVIDISGSAIITGGDFGFEGSILCTILELISLIGILYYFRKKETSQQEKAMATL